MRELDQAAADSERCVLHLDGRHLGGDKGMLQASPACTSFLTNFGRCVQHANLPEGRQGVAANRLRVALRLPHTFCRCAACCLRACSEGPLAVCVRHRNALSTL